MQESLHSCLAKQQAFRQSHEPPTLTEACLRPPLLDVEDSPIPASQPHCGCSSASLLEAEDELAETMLKPGTTGVLESLDPELLQTYFNCLHEGQHPQQRAVDNVNENAEALSDKDRKKRLRRRRLLQVCVKLPLMAST